MEVRQARLVEEPQALLGVGAVEADDQRHGEVDLLGGLDDAPGDLVAAGDAAEDVEEDRPDLLVGGDDLQRVDDGLGLRTAAGVEEVGGCAARLGDDVEGRHAKAGAIAEDADVAVELDVGDALLLGHRLLRVLGGAVVQLREVGMAEHRVAVDRDLRVERHDLAAGGDDQRVDLDQGRVLGGGDLVELHEHLGDSVADVLVDSGLGCELTAHLGGHSHCRIEVPAHQRVGVRLGNRLDVHAAHAGDDRQQLLLGAVEDDRGVVLGGDVRSGLDPQLVHGEALDVHSEDGAGVIARLGLVARQLDAAGLAAAADAHLGLDRARIADLVRRGDGIVDRLGVLSLRHGNAVAGEELFSLILEEVHRRAAAYPSDPQRVVRAESLSTESRSCDGRKTVGCSRAWARMRSIVSTYTRGLGPTASARRARSCSSESVASPASRTWLPSSSMHSTDRWPGVWPGVATARIRPSSVSGRLAANAPNAGPSSGTGSNRTPSGIGWRRTRWKNRDVTLCE